MSRADERPQRARRPLEQRGVYVAEETPERVFAWPRVKARPTEPTSPSWFMYLPMALMFLMMPLTAWASGQPLTLRMFLMYGLTGLVMGGMVPGIYWWIYRRQKQQYEAQLAQRQQGVLRALAQMDAQARRLAEMQRRVLNGRYPPLPLVKQIALDPRWQKKRLWVRELDAEDFLVLRLGEGKGPAPFGFEPLPSLADEDEDLLQAFQQLQQQWQTVDHLPITLPLKRAEVVVVRGARAMIQKVVCRWVVDLAVHHSPRLLHIGVIAAGLEAGQAAWGWMRWLPHTRALEGGDASLLALTQDDGFRLLDHLAARLKTPEQDTSGGIPPPGRGGLTAPNLVLIVDDQGFLRRSPHMHQLVQYGAQLGIYLIFVGDPTIPGVRTEVRVKSDGRFVYKAEFTPADKIADREREVVRQMGTIETLETNTAEDIARALAALEPPEPATGVALLPKKVTLADLLARVYHELDEAWSEEEARSRDDLPALRHPEEALEATRIREMWRYFIRLARPDTFDTVGARQALRRFLHFPVGLTLRRGRLRPLYLNVLPEGSRWGGHAAYHSILIGPTGSGKSEFLKTLIWGAAYLFPPALFQVVFIDFKGGAAVEDLKYRRRTDTGTVQEELLPHIAGLITNPGRSDRSLNARAVSRRGIYAIQLELQRREELITRQGKSQNIWEYNEKVLTARRGEDNEVSPQLPLLPHLLIILDEFSKALSDFPELGDILEQLVRLGRAWGMYLLLANQNVTPQVTRLLDNVGWRIGLRLQGENLREVIRPGLSDLESVGQGYLLCVPLGQVDLFQAGYGGEPLYATAQERWAIYRIEPQGRSREPALELQAEDASMDAETERVAISQGKHLTQMIWHLVRQPEAAFQAETRPIYLEPLPPEIPLTDLWREALLESGETLRFDGATWTSEAGAPTRLRAPIGWMDDLHEVRYETLWLDFEQATGHVWVLGAPDSGHDQVVETLLLSLAHLYTPEQVWFYILDLGAGRLRHLAGLPHTGAYVQRDERERYRRFFLFLHEIYQQRKMFPTANPWPRLIIVLYGFHYRDFLDEAQDEEHLRLLQQLLKDGGKLGLHVVLVSSTPHALREDDAITLGQRLVLHMGKEELFHEAGVPRDRFELTRRVPGRGYWLAGAGAPAREAQVAHCREVTKRLPAMDTSWQGARPPAIRALPPCLTWDAWQAWHAERQSTHVLTAEEFPVGLDFHFRPLTVPVDGGAHNKWLVIGGRGRGKTHLLLLWAIYALRYPGPWSVWYFARRSPPEAWLAHLADAAYAERWHMFVGEEAWPTGWQALEAFLARAREMGGRALLLVDDAADVLPAWAAHDATSSAGVAAEALEDGRMAWVVALRSGQYMQLGSKFYGHPLKSRLEEFQNEKMAIVFSQQALGEMPLNMPAKTISGEFRIAFRPHIRGRAFVLFRQSLHLVQIPFLEPCPEEEKRSS